MPRWLWAAILVVLLCAAVCATALGLRVRREAWDFSQGVHFQGDINNAFQWGRLADQHGLFHLYDDDEAANPPGTRAVDTEYFDLPGHKTDYTPLRLTVAEIWYHWAHRNYPDATGWQDDYDFTAPMLWSNTAAEFLSAVFVFLLIRLWRRRSNPPPEKKPSIRGWLPGFFGALLLWFNPAVIWDGHCWPQWDIWPVPLFLAAALLASLDWWFTAGVALALGASLKGQMLLGAPILLLWPIFRGHFGCALRLLSGFLLITALIVLPWMNPSPPAIHWLIMMAAALLLAAPTFTRWPKFWYIDLALLVPAALLAWPWQIPGVDQAPHAAALRALPLLIVADAAFIRFLPRRLWWPAIGLLAALVIFLLVPMFGVSSAWFRLGFEYGTEKFDFMVTGNGAYNIPRMLRVYENWPESTTEPVPIPFTSITVPFTQLTRITYFTCLALVGIGAAMKDKTRDPRFLVTLAAPWLLFFVILTQMHGRYTIWAAATGALLAGPGLGLALLGVIVSFISWMGILHNQMLFSPGWSPDTLQQFQNLDPAPGFVLLLIAAILLYLSLAPSRRGKI